MFQRSILYFFYYTKTRIMIAYGSTWLTHRSWSYQTFNNLICWMNHVPFCHFYLIDNEDLRLLAFATTRNCPSPQNFLTLSLKVGNCIQETTYACVFSSLSHTADKSAFPSSDHMTSNTSVRSAPSNHFCNALLT